MATTRPGENTVGAPRRRYRAFISYRHADKAWGDWLHRKLESYRVPRTITTETRGLGQIFRDREELAASPDLESEISAALEASDNLIVICSPRAAASEWVNREILDFKRLGRGHRIFAIIVDGEPNAADPALECFPQALKFEIGDDGELSSRRSEPIAADAREQGDGRDNALLKLIAGILGIPYDSLRGREMEAQRVRFRRFAMAAAVLIAVFAGLAGAAGWFAWQAETQRAEAERQRANAEQALTAALDTADTLVFEIDNEVAGSEGVQQRVLLGIQKLAQELIEKLSGGGLPPRAALVNAGSLLRSADAARIMGDLALAARDAEAARAIYRRLLADDPANEKLMRGYAGSHKLSGDVEFDAGAPETALTHYKEAHNLLTRAAIGLAASDDIVFDQASVKLAMSAAYMTLGKLALATSWAGGALKLSEPLAARNPLNASYALNVARSHAAFVRPLELMTDLEGAFDKAVLTASSLETLGLANPGSLPIRLELLDAYNALAHILLVSGNAAAAEKVQLSAVRTGLFLATADSSDAATSHSIVNAVSGMADIRFALGRHGLGARDLSQALQISTAIVRQRPSDILNLVSFAGALRSAGVNFASAGKSSAALLFLRQAQTVYRLVATRTPQHWEYRQFLELVSLDIAMEEARRTARPEQSMR